MARIKIYSTDSCPICVKTKQLLEKWHISYEESRIDQNPAAMREMSELTNSARTVPQIAIDGKWIGGFSELTELHMEGDLDTLFES